MNHKKDRVMSRSYYNNPPPPGPLRLFCAGGLLGQGLVWGQGGNNQPVAVSVIVAAIVVVVVISVVSAELHSAGWV